MTPDEQRMLQELADKIAKTPAPPRDPEAEEFIRSQIGKRPDALYLMTQTVLIQNMALQQAQQQIRELQSARPSGSSSGSGSFLGGGAGYGGAPQNPPPQYQQPQYQGQPQYQSYGAGAPSGAPSFLRGAAQTAAGVAAGALAFEGIRSMFSHPGYGGEGLGGFGGGFGGGGFGDRPIEETVVNNYYDSPGGGADNLSLGDNRDNFADTGTNDAAYDDASDVDYDDGGGFDDGGGDDLS